MAAITPTSEVFPNRKSPQFRTYGTGTANQEDTLTHAINNDHPGHPQRLEYAYCAYSAAPTQAGVTFAIDSALGASYDITLSTGSANAQYTVYSPDEEIWLMPGDGLLITAPAGGVAVTASIVIVTEGL